MFPRYRFINLRPKPPMYHLLLPTKKLLLTLLDLNILSWSGEKSCHPTYYYRLYFDSGVPFHCYRKRCIEYSGMGYQLIEVSITSSQVKAKRKTKSILKFQDLERGGLRQQLKNLQKLPSQTSSGFPRLKDELNLYVVVFRFCCCSKKVILN